MYNHPTPGLPAPACSAATPRQADISVSRSTMHFKAFYHYCSPNKIKYKFQAEDFGLRGL